LKRITVWIDCKEDDVEWVRKELEKFLSSMGLWYKIVDVSELIGVRDTK